MLIAKNLSRYYGTVLAVDDCSFEIDSGEVVGLLGHNGAGKTTIMKMLTGYLEPSSGTINVDGLDVTQRRQEVLENVGYLPENCPLYSEMDVMDYLNYLLELRWPQATPTKRHAALAEAIEKTAIANKVRAPISTLSRGFRQRVGVAQAIVHRPKLLILDEPTNGLDPEQINEMRELICSLRESSTVILSTHILQEVEAVCERVIIMRAGKNALDAKLQDLMQSNSIEVVTDSPLDKLRDTVNSSCELGKDSVQQHQVLDNRFFVTLGQNINDSTLDNICGKLVSKIVEQGHKVFSINRQRKTLESVFREVNEL